MATSGVSVLTRSASDIVTSALRRARIIAVRQPVSPIDLSTGIEALNNMIAELRAQGWHMWKQDEYVLFLEQSKTDYNIGPTGDRAVLLDDLLQTTLGADLTAAATQITLTSTTGYTGSDNQLSSDPAISTGGWTTSNAGVGSDGTTLTITNTASNGYAQYSVTTTALTEYFFEVDVTETTGQVTLEVRSGLSDTLITSQAVTADGTQTIFFTAAEASTVLRFVNDNIAGVTAVSTFLFKQVDTGEKIGFRVSAALREWNVVTRVISTTVVEVQNAVSNAGEADANVLAYKSLPVRPAKLTNYRSKNVDFDDEIPMNTWSRSQYMKQTVKNSQGLPTQAYYEPELGNGRLYIWQVASDVSQVVMFTGDRPMEIFVDNANDADFPAEWFNMLSWGLAAEIGPEYGISESRQKVLEFKADKSKEAASDWDEESGSLLAVPDNNG